MSALDRKVTVTISLDTVRVTLAALHAIGVTAEKIENRRAAWAAHAELDAQWRAALREGRST